MGKYLWYKFGCLLMTFVRKALIKQKVKLMRQRGFQEMKAKSINLITAKLSPVCL